MKKTLIIAGLTIIAATIVVSQIQTNSAPPAKPPPSTVESSKTNTVLGVENFMRNVDRYRGRVQVEGVVSSVSATNQTLGLIDVREFQTCGLEKCAELTLPVRWTGAMPTVGQAFRANGEVQKEKGKLVFVAKTLEKFELSAKGK
ncbi:MAG: hypothetical protein HY011_33670 [Acidobacteria bacterium]|nr:hypothetical protein [Acidobacteriota bacterium]